MFTRASAACGLAPGTCSLSPARVVQAIGGAILTPASLALILGAFPPEKRRAIVGMWSGVGALDAAVGPGAGGILIELATSRAGLGDRLVWGPVLAGTLLFSGYVIWGRPRVVLTGEATGRVAQTL